MKRENGTLPGRGNAALSLLGHEPMLDRLRTTLTDSYASCSLNREGAVDAIGKVVAALARPDMSIDPQRKQELIAKCGELLATLDRVHGLLLKEGGATLQALEKLAKATELLQQFDGRTKG